MKGMMLIGIALSILGLVGLARPVFSTSQNKDVAQLGDIHVQAKETTPHQIPPLVSGGVLALGAILIGASIMKRN